MSLPGKGFVTVTILQAGGVQGAIPGVSEHIGGAPKGKRLCLHDDFLSRSDWLNARKGARV